MNVKQTVQWNREVNSKFTLTSISHIRGRERFFPSFSAEAGLQPYQSRNSGPPSEFILDFIRRGIDGLSGFNRVKTKKPLSLR